MKKLFLLFNLFLFTISYGQYSNYYAIDANVNQNVNVSGSVDVNVNKKVDVSGNINKTIRTIDYGALAQANALKEQNKIDKLKFEDQKELRQVKEIINDPTKSFDYGERYSFRVPKDVTNSGIKNGYRWGYKSFVWSFLIPHPYIFKPVKAERIGFKFENISNDVRTSIELLGQFNMQGITKYMKKLKKEEDFNYSRYSKFYDIQDFDNLKKYVVNQKQKVGKIEDGIYTHKVEVSRATIYGSNGFKITLINEDDFEKSIIEHYLYSDGTEVFSAWAKFSADKNISFEVLEGRRYYLKGLVDKIVSAPFYSQTKL